METNGNANSPTEFEEQESNSSGQKNDIGYYREQLDKMQEGKFLFIGLMVFFIIVSFCLLFLYLSETQSSDKKFTTLREKYNSLRTDYDNLQTMYDALEDSNTQLKEKNKSLEAQASEDRDTINDLRRQVTELKSQLPATPSPSPTAEPTPTPKPTETPDPLLAYETGLTFKDISRNPDKYIGQKVKFSGNVLQIIEGVTINAIRMSTKGDYDDVIYAVYTKSIIDFRLLEDDHITIYGTFEGMETYETIFGSSVTLPKIHIDFIELNEEE